MKYKIEQLKNGRFPDTRLLEDTRENVFPSAFRLRKLCVDRKLGSQTRIF